MACIFALFTKTLINKPTENILKVVESIEYLHSTLLMLFEQFCNIHSTAIPKRIIIRVYIFVDINFGTLTTKQKSSLSYKNTVMHIKINNKI